MSAALRINLKIWISLAAVVLTGCSSNPVLEPLVSLNESVLHQNNGNCETHVALAEQGLAFMRGYSAQRLYSCPGVQEKKQLRCHVSLLVEGPDSSIWVLDNQSILGYQTMAVSGVASLVEYQDALGADEPIWLGAEGFSKMQRELILRNRLSN